MTKPSTRRIILTVSEATATFLEQKAISESRSLSNCAGLILSRAIVADPEALTALEELRSLGIDPVSALRDKLAEVERDTVLSPRA